ncbi:glycosyltransferase family 2 protein [Iodidimonas sp. SYSU 1G8]|uniref:glycosyltransferase family 2 protein n=1 Tax=Iodidimonas sp. SYSU 1G8 TaxID=3133967 RepID=UPI0031FF193B
MSAAPVLADIICTFFNAAGTLPRTIDALTGQTEARIRILLVDDGSTDESATIAERAAAADPRIVSLRNPIRGRGRALNHGIKQSHAPLLAIMDADDIAHPRWIEDMVALMAAHPRHAAIGCGRVYIYGQGDAQWPADSGMTPPRDVTARLGRGNPICHSGSVIRREALAAVSFYDAARTDNFDYDLWVRLMLAGRSLGVTSAVRLAKRYHGGQKFAAASGYVRSSIRVQVRAIRRRGGNPADWLWVLARLVRETVRQRRRARLLERRGHAG